MAAEAQRESERQDDSVVWAPQEGPQHAFVTCPYFDVLFGGARGGGKSDACLGEFANHADEFGAAARGVFMRREMPQADSLIDRSHDIYGPLGWTYTKIDRQWTSPEGSILRFRPLEDDRDAEKYQGQDFSRVYLEELTNWPTPRAPDKMKATLRSARGVWCAFRATANPGGAGHHWVKQRYIDPAPMGMTPIQDEAGNYERMFIPARVRDNVILLAADPGYVDRLKLTGSAALVKAWLEGDWNVIEGAFFDNWATARHVTSAFPIPEHWLRFRSGDWGSARPFSFSWNAIASEDTHLPNGMVLPRGGMVRYREWYGAQSPNVGLKLTAEVVGLGLVQRSTGETYSYSVIDPAAFAQDGGPSIAERIMRTGAGPFRPADNKRIGMLGHIAGWDLCRHRLDGEAPDRPMFVAFDTCSDFIRTVPLLQHDANRAEDVDTEGEDHCFVADTKVLTTDGYRRIVDLVGRVGFVRTFGGEGAIFRSCRLTQRNASVVRVSFNNGVTVECTPDHKFATVNGWEQACRLVGKTLLPYQPRSKSFEASASTSAASIFRRKAVDYIARCGQQFMGLCRKAITSIIATATGRTTLTPTSRYSLAQNTLAITCENVPTSLASALTAIATWPLSGTVATSDALGTASISSDTSDLRYLSALPSIVSNADRRMRQLEASSFRPSTVTRIAKPVLCVSVEPLSERKDVYCLTVPYAGAFAIEGGLIVSNCGDDWRYACASRPWIKPTPQKEAPLTTIADVTLNQLWKARGGKRARL